MLIAVFQFEMLRAGRRRRLYFLRWLYAALLLGLLAPLIFLAESVDEWVAVGGYDLFFSRFIYLHFGLLLLLTPALVGEAIADEKVTGTLEHLLTAPLSPLEIVLGKLAARVVQLALLMLTGLPVMALFAAVAGHAHLMFAILSLSAAMMFGLAGISLLASAWCRQTRDAMLTVYVAGVVVSALGALGFWPWLSRLTMRLDPLAALSGDAAAIWTGVGACVIAWIVMGAIGTLGAALVLRWAFLRQVKTVAAKAWTPRPGIGSNPVLWRERWVEGLLFLRCYPRWLGFAATVVLTAVSFILVLQASLPGVRIFDHLARLRLDELRTALRAAPGVSDALYWHGLAALALAAFIVSIRASGCVSQERDRATWCAVLLTPMTTKSIVRGKYWGIASSFYPYLALYALTALACGLVLRHGGFAWTLVWLMATVYTVQYAAALGLWASVRFASSWSSLLVALTGLYVAWVVFAMPVAAVLAFARSIVELASSLEPSETLIVLLGVMQLATPTALAAMIALVVAFFVLTHRFLAAAERRIGKRDRGREIDPQFQRFYDRWFRSIQQRRYNPPPPAPSVAVDLSEPVPLAEEASSAARAADGTEEDAWTRW